MKALKARLAAHLEANGWDVLEQVNDLEWWADEVWALTSRWSPTDAFGYITFLVDPLWEGERRPGQGLWAIGCSANYPENRVAACDEGKLRLQPSPEELELFFRRVNAFRTWERD